MLPIYEGCYHRKEDHVVEVVRAFTQEGIGNWNRKRPANRAKRHKARCEKHQREDRQRDPARRRRKRQNCANAGRDGLAALEAKPRAKGMPQNRTRNNEEHRVNTVTKLRRCLASEKHRHKALCRIQQEDRKEPLQPIARTALVAPLEPEPTLSRLTPFARAISHA